MKEHAPPPYLRTGWCIHCPYKASGRGMDSVVAALKDHVWYCATERAREAQDASQQSQAEKERRA